MKVFLIFLLSLSPLFSCEKTDEGEPIIKKAVCLDQKTFQFITQKRFEMLKDLHESGHFWYKVGNTSESLSHVFGGATPVLALLSSGTVNLPRKDFLLLLSGVSATFVFSCSQFAKYAHNESRERFKDLNALLVQNGYKQILGIMGESLATDMTDPQEQNPKLGSTEK